MNKTTNEQRNIHFMIPEKLFYEFEVCLAAEGINKKKIALQDWIEIYVSQKKFENVLKDARKVRKHGK